MRVALEIRTSLRPERPGTPPEGNVKQGESRERRGEKRQKTGRTETDRRSEGARAKDTERQRRTQHQSAQEGEKKERSRNGRAKVVTPSVKISGWLWGYEQSQRASEHNETIRGRGTDSPGPVCGQKSPVPKSGEKAGRDKPRKDKEAGGCKANQPTLKEL